jgi:hypothetical protein
MKGFCDDAHIHASTRRDIGRVGARHGSDHLGRLLGAARQGCLAICWQPNIGDDPRCA